VNRPTKMFSLIASLLLLVFAVTPSALAHAHPKIMKPAPDSTGPAPASISITFSEGVEPKFSSIRLVAGDGKSATAGVSRPVPNDPTTLILPVPKLHPGTYTVQWSNVALDGHRLEGSYKFTVK